MSLAPKYQMAKHQAVTPSPPVPCKSQPKAPQGVVEVFMAPGYCIAYIDEVGAGGLKILTLVSPYGRTIDVQLDFLGRGESFQLTWDRNMQQTL